MTSRSSLPLSFEPSTRSFRCRSKKLSMQIVPYMPVHPSQLQSVAVSSVNTSDNQMEEETKSEEKLSPVPVPRTPVHSDDHLFKRPFTPPAYTVEEPCDTPIERPQRMKRSFSTSSASIDRGDLFLGVIPNQSDRIVI